MGSLGTRLRANTPEFAGVEDFLDLPRSVRLVRHDLLHALPVPNGLHRRLRVDPFHVRDLYTVESLREALAVMEMARNKGNEVAVCRWWSRGMFQLRAAPSWSACEPRSRVSKVPWPTGPAARSAVLDTYRRLSEGAIPNE